MFCGECGAQNPDSNQFCRNCGKPLVRRQPAAQPAAQPAHQPAPVPAAVPAKPVMQPAAAASPAPAPALVAKRRLNWPGFVSLVLGILSWIIYTGIFAIVAILLGIISLVWFRKATGRIGISAIIGIVLGIAAIAIIIALS